MVPSIRDPSLQEGDLVDQLGLCLASKFGPRRVRSGDVDAFVRSSTLPRTGRLLGLLGAKFSRGFAARGRGVLTATGVSAAFDLLLSVGRILAIGVGVAACFALLPAARRLPRRFLGRLSRMRVLAGGAAVEIVGSQVLLVLRIDVSEEL